MRGQCSSLVAGICRQPLVRRDQIIPNVQESLESFLCNIGEEVFDSYSILKITLMAIDLSKLRSLHCSLERFD